MSVLTELFKAMEANVIQRSELFQLTKQTELADGTTVSIQAGPTHFCQPPELLPYDQYETFECWFPEDDGPRNDVSKDEIEAYINQHGGLKP